MRLSRWHGAGGTGQGSLGLGLKLGAGPGKGCQHCSKLRRGASLSGSVCKNLPACPTLEIRVDPERAGSHTLRSSRPTSHSYRARALELGESTVEKPAQSEDHTQQLRRPHLCS